MLRSAARLAVVVSACAATTAMMPSSQALPPTELLGGGEVIPLKDAAMISRTDVGYRLRAGQQDSHLVVTLVGGRLHFADTGTAELRRFPKACRAEDARVGVAVSCRVPARYDGGNPMFLEVWPRLGDDVVDGSALPSSYRLWVLADAGEDTVLGGAGDDFVNGAQDDDLVRGGAGDDWLRTGIGRDEIGGDAGADELVAGDGADRAHGGDGDDRVGGGAGPDQLSGDAGRDTVVCGTGTDVVWLDLLDRAVGCESEHS